MIESPNNVATGLCLPVAIAIVGGTGRNGKAKPITSGLQLVAIFTPIAVEAAIPETIHILSPFSRNDLYAVCKNFLVAIFTCVVETDYNLLRILLTDK
jgi:hypothetical protein